MTEITFKLDREFINLNDLLKITGLVDSGGMGKVVVGEGLVSVDGAIELRKTAKIRVGQVVELSEQKIIIT